MSKNTRTRKRPTTHAFVLGMRAFRKICAVEGIEPSKELEADLVRLSGLPAEERRLALMEKYGRVR